VTRQCLDEKMNQTTLLDWMEYSWIKCIQSRTHRNEEEIQNKTGHPKQGNVNSFNITGHNSGQEGAILESRYMSRDSQVGPFNI